MDALVRVEERPVEVEDRRAEELTPPTSRTIFPTFSFAAIRRWASAARSSGKTESTRGRSARPQAREGRRGRTPPSGATFSASGRARRVEPTSRSLFARTARRSSSAEPPPIVAIRTSRPPRREEADVPPEGRAADRVEDEADRRPSRTAPRSASAKSRAVVSTTRSAPSAASARPSPAERTVATTARPRCLRELDRRRADARGGRVDEDGLARGEGALAEEVQVRREPRFRDRRGLLERQAFGDRHQHPARDRDPLGVAAAGEGGRRRARPSPPPRLPPRGRGSSESPGGGGYFPPPAGGRRG